MQPCAVHVFLVNGGHVLLLRRVNTGYEDGNYSVIAGHLDGGEEVIAAALREAREEAGITLAPEAMRVVGVMHRHSNDERIDFFIEVSAWQGEISNAEPEKCSELTWYPLDALPANIIPYVRDALDRYQHSQGALWFESYGW
ncbi:MAG: NUDIX domain-containing protein [Ktedonobacterales bacterium]